MTLPIALQLYSVREQLAQDFRSVIERIARMGYVGVETAEFTHVKPDEAAKLFDALGLIVPSMHAPMHRSESRGEALDTAAALGCKRIVVPWIPAEEFAAKDQIKRNCDHLNEADQIAREHGLSLGYHNHWWEFRQINGFYPYQIMLRHLAPTVFFELDTYWIKTGGCDPVQVIGELGARVPLIHLKDGSAQESDPMVALGDGTMDIPAVVQAAQTTTEWLIVELDRCDSDMMQAVEKSYGYLTLNGLGRGQAGSAS